LHNELLLLSRAVHESEMPSHMSSYKSRGPSHTTESHESSQALKDKSSQELTTSSSCWHQEPNYWNLCCFHSCFSKSTCKSEEWKSLAWPVA